MEGKLEPLKKLSIEKFPATVFPQTEFVFRD
jgi:hypothetical protein